MRPNIKIGRQELFVGSRPMFVQPILEKNAMCMAFAVLAQIMQLELHHIQAKTSAFNPGSPWSSGGSVRVWEAPSPSPRRRPRRCDGHALACGTLLCPAPISRGERHKFLLNSSNSSPSTTGGHRQKHRCTPQPQSSITIEPHSTNPTVPNKSLRSYPLPPRKMGQDRVSLVIALVLVSLLAAGLLLFGYIMIRIAIDRLYGSLRPSKVVDANFTGGLHARAAAGAKTSSWARTSLGTPSTSGGLSRDTSLRSQGLLDDKTSNEHWRGGNGGRKGSTHTVQLIREWFYKAEVLLIAPTILDEHEREI
ncbi:hypothetical protein V490_06821 [Pseudogymnoascus sp. VKM F-3557]|nr:hypothetical protein V490_06821 [Pseudogymnoascus sp. VKM F-3557]